MNNIFKGNRWPFPLSLLQLIQDTISKEVISSACCVELLRLYPPTTTLKLHSIYDFFGINYTLLSRHRNFAVVVFLLEVASLQSLAGRHLLQPAHICREICTIRLNSGLIGGSGTVAAC